MSFIQTLSGKPNDFSEGAQKEMECFSQSFPEGEVTTFCRTGKGFIMLFSSSS